MDDDKNNPINQQYLVPANSKKQTLIFGFLRKIDLIIASVGMGISFILLTFIPVSEVWGMIITIAPIAIAALLVFPIPNYHNTLVLIQELLEYRIGRKEYIWRGWCYKYEQSDK